MQQVDEMKLNEWLEANNNNRAQFCRDLGISRAHLYRILNGENSPGPKLAEKIEKATDGQVTVMELLFPERFK